MRWKIFIPLAIVLTAAGLLGSIYWSNTASTRYLSVLDTEATDVVVEGKTITIKLKNGQALADILDYLDGPQLAKVTRERELVLSRVDMLPVDTSLTQEVHLILAQAVATKEYYKASLMLRDLAADRGYSSEMLIWQGMLIAEIADTRHSYIALYRQEVMAQ